MLLIRVGRRRINLEYLIEDEEGDGSPETVEIPVGAIRVTLQRGKEFVLAGDDAEKYRRQVEPFVLKDPAAQSPGAPFSRPSVGHLAPRPAEPEAKKPRSGKPKAPGPAPGPAPGSPGPVESPGEAGGVDEGEPGGQQRAKGR